jgi:hypothetical protein
MVLKAIIHKFTPTTRPKEDMLSPLVCMKSVMVLPSTGESSRDAKSDTCANCIPKENKLSIMGVKKQLSLKTIYA